MEMQQGPDVPYLVDCLQGILKEIPKLIVVLQEHTDELRETQARLDRLERAAQYSDQASVARTFNATACVPLDPIKSIRLPSGALPIIAFPRTLGEFWGLDATRLQTMALRYGIAVEVELPESVRELQDLVADYLGMRRQAQWTWRAEAPSFSGIVL
ncbi:hypothetical protein RSOLAG22IIIB_00026 [Rhizoctonia solani]|uniref:Uncharacterized protein n=1 Tax=Rhizoctonia solani TaxID=456999 RepID=A0A0K6FK18_9AGAM|nr:hypothetical protein RSOLAG22IIIB_00026 [Rhizoctonia solani]